MPSLKNNNQKKGQRARIAGMQKKRAERDRQKKAAHVLPIHKTRGGERKKRKIATVFLGGGRLCRERGKKMRRGKKGEGRSACGYGVLGGGTGKREAKGRVGRGLGEDPGKSGKREKGSVHRSVDDLRSHSNGGRDKRGTAEAGQALKGEGKKKKGGCKKRLN